MCIPHGEHTKVLIVGAGPSGLMMAAQLLRHGVTPIIIDKRSGPTNHSKALAVQARTLEIYHQLGIDLQAIKEGKIAEGADFYLNGALKQTFNFEGIGAEQTPFPYVLFYQQSKNERLLLDMLTQSCCSVYWETHLTQVQQKDNKVTVQLRHAENIYTITCDWLIGADGAHSEVRKQLDIPFAGDTYPHHFYLADVKLDYQLGKYLQIHLSKNNLAAIFPMPEASSYRIIGNIPPAIENKTEIEIHDILPSFMHLTDRNIHIAQINWFTTYQLHHRMADKFRLQRCFLIGDAAHIHSPVGGQGMNTGIQDAYNLGWKLAGVVNGRLHNLILDSYAAERIPVAKELLATTDRVFNIIISNNWFWTLFKKWIIPKGIQLFWKNNMLRTIFFKRLSQTNISYRNSKLNLHLSHTQQIKAGDRLPYLKIYDEKTQEETDLHAWCLKPGFVLIILGKLKEVDLFTLAKWINNNYLNSLHLFYLPPSAKNSHIFEAFEVGKEQKKALIIRPDMHIGFMNDVIDIEMMDNYMLNVAGYIQHP